MFTLHRKRRSSPADDTTDPDAVAAVPIALSAVLRPLATALAFRSDGRYHVAAPGEHADIVVVEPRSAAEIRELRLICAQSALVVWDRAQGTSPASVVDTLEAGADAYVTDPNVTVLMCHLRALQRRVEVGRGCFGGGRGFGGGGLPGASGEGTSTSGST